MKGIDFYSMFFVWLGIFVFVSLVTAGTVIFFGKKKGYIPEKLGALTVPYFVLLFTVPFCLSFSVFNGSLAETVFVMFTAVVLMMCGYRGDKNLIKAGTAAAILTSFLFLPSGSFDYTFLPVAVVSAVALWLFFIYSLFKMNKVDGLVVSEGSFIGFIVFAECLFLSLSNSVHIMSSPLVAFAAISFALALYSFKNWTAFPAKIRLGAEVLLPAGFVLGWLLLKMAASGAWIFAIILPLLFLMETGYALLKQHFKKEPTESFAVQAAESGAYHNLIVKHIFRANLGLAVFAAFTPQSGYSLALLGISVVWVILEMDKLKHFGQPEPTIRGITKGIFSELKKSFAEQKEFYTEVSKNYKESGNLKDALASAAKENDEKSESKNTDTKGKKKAEKEAKKID